MRLSDAHVLMTEPLKGEDAKWTRLILTTFKDPLGTQRTWEHAERQTRPKSSSVDGVGIVAVLNLPSGPELVLQRQYRPPVNAVCIEIPAGLVDEGETPEQAALRELKEETGYIGEISMSTSVMLNVDPGFCNTNLKMIHMTIDINRPENQNPQPELEENEFIEVFTLPLKDLYSHCEKWEKEGYALDARVATLAEGIEMAKRWGL
ncbi:ADP-ribose pyrophosphatase/MutT/nudix family protein [Blumeria hordei DH14]|uniref:ADP-ribose pyrophosphatase/MutT/nudix family protein n=1 Tax=Blumeria graminis f. sp. hordei (strain DH14) TaxID=546991 RepID=N1JI23_BLUG1|nr:ADP-ribose pyrophosphatase/MutT/nudix family protein [Blumeria hordei DH14]